MIVRSVIVGTLKINDLVKMAPHNIIQTCVYRFTKAARMWFMCNIDVFVYMNEILGYIEQAKQDYITSCEFAIISITIFVVCPAQHHIRLSKDQNFGNYRVHQSDGNDVWFYEQHTYNVHFDKLDNIFDPNVIIITNPWWCALIHILA